MKRSESRIILAITLLFLCLNGVLFAQWNTSIIDHSVYERLFAGDACSAAIDANGFVHVTYCVSAGTSWSFIHVWQSETGWMSETVFTANNNAIGLHCSLAIGSDGILQVVFSNPYGAPANPVVIYGKKENGAWQFENVKFAPYANSEVYPNLTLDTQNQPHLVYRIREDNYINVYYANKNGQSWNNRLIDSQNYGGWSLINPSIALDKFDRPHLIYFKNKQLQYSWFDGSNWKFNVLKDNVYGTTCIVIDKRSNTIHIAFDNQQTNVEDFYYGYKDNIGWTIDKIASDYRGQLHTIRLDYKGNPQIFYESISSYFDVTFRWAVKLNSSWNFSIVWSNRFSTWRLGWLDFVLNAAGEPFFVYYDNMNSSSLWFSKKQDYGPTNFSLLLPENSTWAKEPITYLWNPSSLQGMGLEKYTIEIDGKLINKNISKFQSFATFNNNLADGWHTWRVQAVTLDNQIIWSTETWSFRIDTAPPEPFTLQSPSDNTWSADRTPSLSWSTTSDAGSSLQCYRLYIDNSLAIDSISASINSIKSNYELPDRSHTWYISALDQAGNERKSDQIWTLKIDKTPPQAFTLISPVDNFWTGAVTPRFQWDSSNDSGVGLASYELKIERVRTDKYLTYAVHKDSTSYSLKTSEALLKGDHRWYLRAIDLLGNVFETNFYTIRIDLNPPLEFTLTSPLDSAYINFPTPEFIWAAASDNESGLSHYQLWIDELLSIDNLKTVKTAPAMPITEGKHSWFVRAIDNVGNIRISKKSIFYGEWNSPEPFSLISPKNNSITQNGHPQFVWHQAVDKGCGIDKYQLWINGALNRDNISANDTTAIPMAFLPSGDYSWQIKAFDKAGNSRLSKETYNLKIDVPSDVNENIEDQIPKTFALYQNYPNPFNLLTKIEFDLPRASYIKLCIYNACGEKVRTLAEGNTNAGHIKLQWDGHDEFGLCVPSGVYIVSFTADNFKQTMKLCIIK